MSRSPKPPGRSVLMYKLSPSFEMAGSASMKEVLITGPRLTGSDHGPYAAWPSATSRAVTLAAGPTGLLSGLHATARAASTASRAILPLVAIIVPLLLVINCHAFVAGLRFDCGASLGERRSVPVTRA